MELGKVVGIRMPVDILEAYAVENASTGIRVSTLARRDLIRGFSLRSDTEEISTQASRNGAEKPVSRQERANRTETQPRSRRAQPASRASESGAA